MVAGTNSAGELLEAAYIALDLNQGELLSANSSPSNETNLEQWLDKGDWLVLAEQVGAEKIFFVKNDPVIVFAKSESQDVTVLRKLFNRIWCMARPQRLFLAVQGELRVYDLTKSPIKKDEDWGKNKPLAVAKSITEVAKELNNYRREKVESGKLFEEERFGHDDQRADQALIRDLKTVRARLTNPDVDKSLERKYAHALIGRSIFIRYLEDRKILDKAYFKSVAAKHPQWQAILDTPLNKQDLDSDMEKLLYPRVLEDKAFTYALFDQLSEDFNGDMFPSDPEEKKAVDIEHLKLLQNFLRGDVSEQQNLFFWAYKFNIIPIELISSIYEEFYLTANADAGNHGTHYTPSSLVRFVLSQVLTPECLEKNPRILDPCCGSGIFLVEAFRRIVRYRVYNRNGRRLSSKELRKIIKDQLAGIEINEEAIRVAAFSLYLALLHFQEPPAIRQQKRLPSLKYQEGDSRIGEKYDNLLEANTFAVAERVQDSDVLSKFSSSSFDVIVGNPPWGTPERDDKPGKEALKTALQWCKQRGYPVGDDERSQAFIWRTLDFLKNGGYAGLLVSTGIFFKHHQNSKDFRRQWLSSIDLKEVVNFSHVRNIFFSGAISPFASVVFQKRQDFDVSYPIINYFSAKKTIQSVRLKSVVLSYADLQRVRQVDLLEDDKLWKVYWWGNQRDLTFIKSLELNPSLKNFCDLENTGRGFQVGNKEKLSDWLEKYQELPTSSIVRYGNLNLKKLKRVPKKVERRGKSEGVYSGTRILVKRGISQRGKLKGQVVAHLTSDSFCFRNSIHCIKLNQSNFQNYKVILSILWSSLARYYFFLTTSTWGLWHHEIHTEELLGLPICFPNNDEEMNKLIDLVDQLSRLDPSTKPTKQRNAIQLEFAIISPDLKNQHAEIAHLEYQLDEAIFDLYGLRVSERDLIRDMCDIGIDFFYNDVRSEAIKPIITSTLQQKHGLLDTISSSTDSGVPSELKDYLTVFLKAWNREVCPEGEFSWRVIISDQTATMLCLVFSTQELGFLPQFISDDDEAWTAILEELDNALLVPYNSDHIYIDGIVRAVTDTDIIIIKRNERRLWTKSMAREDVEATLLQAVNLQESRQSTSV